MEHNLWKSVLANQLVKGTIDNLSLNRSAIGGAEHQIEIKEFVTEKVFVFFDGCFSLNQHLSNRLRQEYLSDTGFGLWCLKNQRCVSACIYMWELKHNILFVQFLHCTAINTLQFFFNKDACMPLFNADRGNIYTIPGQSQQFSHSQGTGEGKID